MRRRYSTRTSATVAAFGSLVFEFATAPPSLNQ